MHTEQLSDWIHDHTFDRGSRAAERSTRLVMWITLVMMVVEITAGWWFNSMALLADGWHMSSHALAIGLTVMAYAAARRYARDPRFAFGTWKIEVLGGFASAILLIGVALIMVVTSMERIWQPQSIRYEEAMVVALLGLGVNVVCALILGRVHHHDHGHGHGHSHFRESHFPDSRAHDHHHDLNLRSAYLHIVADAATSVLAVAALAGGWMYGWWWLDPLMGLLGAVLVASWAMGLIRDTGTVLLDREMDHPVVDEIREVIEGADDGHETRLTDLHVWRVGRQSYACALTVVTHDRSLTPTRLREQLAVHEEIVHSTIELHWCPDAAQPA